MPKKSTSPQTKSKSAAPTYSDLLGMRYDLQRSLAASPENLKAVLQSALDNVNEQMAPLELGYRQRHVNTWHRVSPEDQKRITCGHCGNPATICFHAHPGYVMVCPEHADVDPMDRIWDHVSNEDAMLIGCDVSGCDEPGTSSLWVPGAPGTGVTRHYCQYHCFGPESQA